MDAYLALDVIIEQNNKQIEQMDRLIKVSEMSYQSQRRVESRFMLVRIIYGVIVAVFLIAISWFSFNFYIQNKIRIDSITTENLISYVSTKSKQGMAAIHSVANNPVEIIISEMIGGNYKPLYTHYAINSYDSSNEAIPLVRSEGERVASVEIGGLSAKYESHGYYGVIGRDKTGGWSYGKFQIATKTGTMKVFMRWLKRHDIESYNALSVQGGYKAAYKASKGFVRVWRELSKGNRFQQSQYNFIKDTHYNVLVNNMDKFGVDVSRRSLSFKNVVWSTAVQHGGRYGKNNSGGAAIMERVFKKVGKNASDKDAINYLYRIRGEYFSSSSSRVRKAVKNRFKKERLDALKSL